MRGAPPWADAFLPQFEGLLERVRLTEDFVLLPVETPSEDVIDALIGFLEDRGYRSISLKPRSDEEWADLPAQLLSLSPVADEVVLLIGPEEPALPEKDAAMKDAAMKAALRLLNQRRDSLVESLRCSFLYCGPGSFLQAIWESAPDFWSIRAMTQRLISPPLPVDPPLPAWMEWDEWESLSELAPLLRAAADQGDGPNAARIALRMAYIAGAESHFQAARRLLATGLGHLRGAGAATLAAQIHLLRAKIDLIQGRLRRADTRRRKALKLTSPDATMAQGISLRDGYEAPRISVIAAQQSGLLALSRGDLAAAETAYQDALEQAQAAGNPHGLCNSYLLLGDLHLVLGSPQQAAAAYGRYVEYSLRARGAHLRHRQDLQLSIGLLCAATFRFRQAMAHQESALKGHEYFENRLGAAQARLALGDLHRTLGAIDAAAERYRQAIQNFEVLDVPMGLDRARRGLMLIARSPLSP